MILLRSSEYNLFSIKKILKTNLSTSLAFIDYVAVGNQKVIPIIWPEEAVYG